MLSHHRLRLSVSGNAPARTFSVDPVTRDILDNDKLLPLIVQPHPPPLRSPKMGAESKEALLPQHTQHDLESGTSSPPGRSFCLPPLALLRRKKFLVFLLLIPAVYYFTFSSSYTSASDAGTRMLEALHHPSASINDLAGKLPSLHHYDDAKVDSEGHLHNALLDELHVEGTKELSALKDRLDATGAAKDSGMGGLSVEQMHAFTPKAESLLLLLLALQKEDYKVGQDWKGVYLDRTPLETGVFGKLGSAPSNRFTQLLSTLPLPSHNSTGEEGFSILNDPLQLYSLNRSQWVQKAREGVGLTVFSKSYCPYSKRAKSLLKGMGAKMTVYEVDLRPDARELQALLGELTGHRTFPTILVRDKLVGGSDDLQDMEKIGALRSMLESVGAV